MHSESDDDDDDDDDEPVRERWDDSDSSSTGWRSSLEWAGHTSTANAISCFSSITNISRKHSFNEE